MPLFTVQQYEIHAQTYHIEAASEAAAVARLFAGKAAASGDRPEYVELLHELGLPVDEYPELVKELAVLGVTISGDIIPSLRSIEAE